VLFYISLPASWHPPSVCWTIYLHRSDNYVCSLAPFLSNVILSVVVCSWLSICPGIQSEWGTSGALDVFRTFSSWLGQWIGTFAGEYIRDGAVCKTVIPPTFLHQPLCTRFMFSLSSLIYFISSGSRCGLWTCFLCFFLFLNLGRFTSWACLGFRSESSFRCLRWDEQVPNLLFIERDFLSFLAGGPLLPIQSL